MRGFGGLNLIWVYLSDYTPQVQFSKLELVGEPFKQQWADTLLYVTAGLLDIVTFF